MDTIKALLERRAKVVESLRALVETAQKEERALSGEEKARYEKHKAEYEELSTRITQAQETERMVAAMDKPLDSGRGDSGAPGADGKGKEARAAYWEYMRRGVNALSPEQRALVEDTTGEILVPEDLDAEIDRAIGAITVMRDLVEVRRTTSDRVRRRSMDEVAVGWGKLETGTVITETTLTPDQAYVYVEDLYGLTRIGEDELADTDANLEAYVSDSFGRAIAEAEDTAIINGRGHTTYEEPEGILDGATVTRVVAGQVAAVTVEDFLALIYAVPAQFRKAGKFVMASATELAIALLRGDGGGGPGTGPFLWQPAVAEGRPNTFLGWPIFNQEDVDAIPASGYTGDVAIFGDHRAGYRLYDREGRTIKRLEELYATSGLVGFRAKFRVGGAVIRPNALRILQVPAS